jgi:hypothetical protein
MRVYPPRARDHEEEEARKTREKAKREAVFEDEFDDASSVATRWCVARLGYPPPIRQPFLADAFTNRLSNGAAGFRRCCDIDGEEGKDGTREAGLHFSGFAIIYTDRSTQLIPHLSCVNPPQLVPNITAVKSHCTNPVVGLRLLVL